MSTTDFNDAVQLCENSFDECTYFIKEWKEVKESKDFDKLSDFLKTYDVTNKVFKIN